MLKYSIDASAILDAWARYYPIELMRIEKWIF